MNSDWYDIGCPNSDTHETAIRELKPGVSFLNKVIDEVHTSMRFGGFELIGGRDVARVFGVRASTGHTVVAKVFDSKADISYFETERQIYEDFLFLQGRYLPVFLAATHCQFLYSKHHSLIMSYGGIPADTVEITPKLLENIVKAFEAIHRLGIWHANLCPSNILVGENNKICIIDFKSSVACKDGKAIVLAEQRIVERVCERSMESGRLNFSGIDLN